MVFKAYDIRGKYPEDINEVLFNSIAKSVHILGDIKKVVVGADMRLSSPALKEALIEGLQESGIDVIDIGLASTPMIYQFTGDYDVDLGIIITASHNPGRDNGMKICRNNAIPIAWNTGIQDLKEAVEKKEFIKSHSQGALEKKDYKEEYFNKVSKYANPHRKLKVVFDAGNGIGGLIDDRILEQFCHLEKLYCDLDGTFPNHAANPIVEETLEDLKEKVIETQADVGFAFDGDADRVGLIDERGIFIPADKVAAFLIKYYVEKFPREENYSYDLRSSKVVKELIESFGKKGFETRVGHSFVKSSMRDKNSFFSSELSGHYYFWFEDKLVYDSAIRTSLEVLNVLSQEDRTLSECIEEFNKYYKCEETNFEVTNKEEVLSALKKEYSNALMKKLDGITFTFDDWWFNVRCSNTENKIRLNLEGNTKNIFEKKYDEVCKLISLFN